MKICDLLKSVSINVHAQATNKEEAIDILVDLMDQ